MGVKDIEITLRKANSQMYKTTPTKISVFLYLLYFCCLWSF